MEGIGTLLGSIVDLRIVGLAVTLALLVLGAGFILGRNSKKRKQKPGQYTLYRAEGMSAAQCRGVLGDNAPQDLFCYELEAAPKGGWYLNLKEYRPTQQILDTVFLLQFVEEEPAAFSLTFIREAFGMREPLASPALLQQFFAQKLGAAPVESTGEEG